MPSKKKLKKKAKTSKTRKGGKAERNVVGKEDSQQRSDTGAIEAGDSFKSTSSFFRQQHQRSDVLGARTGRDLWLTVRLKLRQVLVLGAQQKVKELLKGFKLPPPPPLPPLLPTPTLENLSSFFHLSFGAYCTLPPPNLSVMDPLNASIGGQPVAAVVDLGAWEPWRKVQLSTR